MFDSIEKLRQHHAYASEKNPHPEASDYLTLFKLLEYYADASSFHEIFLEVAYEQIVVEGEISFAHDEKIRLFILQSLMENHLYGRSLTQQDFLHFQKMNQDSAFFAWPLYQRCLEICEQQQLYPFAFSYLRNQPQKPHSIQSALPFFTVEGLKEILNKNNIKRSGRRKELEDSVISHLSFEQIRETARIRYAERYLEWERKANRDKFFELWRMILARAQTLLYLSKKQNQALLEHGYVLKLTLNSILQDDQKLAQALDGTGYSTVLKQGQIQKLLPLFPRDQATLLYQKDDF